MKPVDQTMFADRVANRGGNCMSACIASLLDLDIAKVPYFMGDLSADEPDEVWQARINRWLAPRGLYFMHFRTKGFTRWPPGYFILTGRSPRDLHAVVAKGGKIVHDPHPSRDGLKSIDGFALLVPLDPASVRSRHR